MLGPRRGWDIYLLALGPTGASTAFSISPELAKQTSEVPEKAWRQRQWEGRGMGRDGDDTHSAVFEAVTLLIL